MGHCTGTLFDRSKYDISIGIYYTQSNSDDIIPFKLTFPFFANSNRICGDCDCWKVMSYKGRENGKEENILGVLITSLYYSGFFDVVNFLWNTGLVLRRTYACDIKFVCVFLHLFLRRCL